MQGTWMLRAGAAGFLAALLVGCTSSKEKPSTDVEESPWEVRVESPLDTVDYAQGETPAEAEASEPVLEMPKVIEERPPAAQPTTAAATPPVPKPEEFTPGWRVQIFASPNMASADKVAERARQQFTEPVYVEFQPPNYKVRVGDFLTKPEATSMATRAKAQGFEGSWVVEALVRQHRP